MQTLSCFHIPCTKAASFKCKGTSFGTFMCDDHKNQHLASSFCAHNIEPLSNFKEKEKIALAYLVNEGAQLEQLLLHSIKGLESLSSSACELMLQMLQVERELENKDTGNSAQNLLILMACKNQMIKKNLKFVSEVIKIFESDVTIDSPNDNFINQLFDIYNKDADKNAILSNEGRKQSPILSVMLLKSAARGYLARQEIKQEKSNQIMDKNAILSNEERKHSPIVSVLLLKSAARGYPARQEIKEEKYNQSMDDLYNGIAINSPNSINISIPRVLFSNPKKSLKVSKSQIISKSEVLKINKKPQREFNSSNSTSSPIKLQSVARGYLAKKKISKRSEEGVTKLQSAARGYLARKLLRKPEGSAINLQNVTREYLVTKSQRAARGYLARKKFSKMTEEFGEEEISNSLSTQSSIDLNISRISESKLKESNIKKLWKIATSSNELNEDPNSPTINASIKIIEGGFYTGEINTKGQRNGNGTYIWKKAKYVGYWKNDKMVKGKYVNPNGTLYDGEWKNGIYHGKGTWFDLGENGDEENFEVKYEGSFYDGKMHGFGKYIWKDGSIYEGEFINNQMSGNGIFIDSKISKPKEEIKDGESIRETDI